MSDALPGAFEVSLDGFEGPLDLLLDLARAQKVDLRKISVLALADQYLGYLEAARAARLEIAADYLVMAAWLAYLKSQLLLPPPEQLAPEALELARELALRLQRLEAIRRAVEWLQVRPRLHEARQVRGGHDELPVRIEPRWTASLTALLAAYGQAARRTTPVTMRLKSRRIVTVEAMLNRLSRLLTGHEWRQLAAFLPEELADPLERRTAVAASFVAALELARSGAIELSQAAAFAPIMVRGRQ